MVLLIRKLSSALSFKVGLVLILSWFYWADSPFLLLILGLVFITIGISHQLSPTYTTKKKIEFIPRSVYDEIVSNSTLGY